MTGRPATSSASQDAYATAGDLNAQVRETHTGIVFLVGDKAYKAKKAVTTDFLDFSTPERRQRACEHEVSLNRRLAPDSYLGVAHFNGPEYGHAEPLIVMRRYSDDARLASLVTNNEPVDRHLCAIAEKLARFHETARRSRVIDTHGSIAAVSARWEQNLAELAHYGSVVPRESLREIARLAAQFGRGREALFVKRISDHRIVDGHGDLLADDIFCLPQDEVLLDCLEFDDNLRYLDGIDDAAFLAMDLEFLGRKELGDYFCTEYSRSADDPAPRALWDFYIAYRAIVRAKVDCIRVSQGHLEARTDACRHIEIALDHLRACTVRLILIGGGPGSGKTTLSRALAQALGAEVISTDEVRREMARQGAIDGRVGELNAGLYTPENVSRVYDEVLLRARCLLTAGRSVILDGTWRDADQRKNARLLAGETASPISEFTCSVPTSLATARVEERPVSTSDATSQIAEALAEPPTEPFDGYRIDTSRPLPQSVSEAQKLCCLAT